MKFSQLIATGLICLLCGAARAVPPPALTPAAEVQAARQALLTARSAKTLPALNGAVTRASAAQIGVGMAFGLSLAADIGETQTGAEKAYMAGVRRDLNAMLGRYHVTDAQISATVKSGILPTTLAAQGHPFLQDTLALVTRLQEHQHRKSGLALHAPPLPLPAQCDFRVLGPDRVQIVPRAKDKSPLQASLEDGQWKIDLGQVLQVSVKDGPNHSAANPAHPEPLTPQAAALLKAIEDNDLGRVTALLQADPSLANAPVGVLPGQHVGGDQEVSETPLVKAIYGGNPAIVTLLLSDKAAVNAPDMVGQTPLSVAAGLHDPAIVRLLLAHGGRINTPDFFGKTPLHEAAEDGHADVVTLLLSAGASVNAREASGKTPLDFAVQRGNTDVVALLRQHGGRK